MATPAYFDQCDERYKISLSTLAENRDKNRYIDIMPYDSSRFIFQSATNGGYLERLGGFFKHIIQGGNEQEGAGSGTEYINANYVNMNGGNGQIRRWIAAQGPLQLTINDFWRMIHER